jgi:ribosomal protein S18 acetylase RimI-like enzyme
MVYKMKIHSLTFEHYDSIIALWKRADLHFKPLGRDNPKEMKKQFERDFDIILGAFEDGELIGVIIGSDDGRKGWINRLAVDPDFQGRGIGMKLVGSLEEALKKRGRKIICTLIEGPNETSFGLFEKMGYVKHRDIIYLSKRESNDI